MTVNCRIFIAGTGRCGTSRLTQLLGTHTRIYSIENETRFIIDPGGLQDLVESLTSRYTMYNSHEALKRFDILMRETLVGRTENAFKTWQLDKYLGHNNYYENLNLFLSKIIDYEYDGRILYDLENNPHNMYWPSQAKSYRRVIGKYFHLRKYIIEHCREFIDSLFGTAANSINKDCWCEKTPLNLLSMDFLWEMFPDAYIVHIKRDPRGVAFSLTQQPWAPREIENTIKILIPIYERWRHFKENYRFDEKKYIEIKSEDFFSDCRHRAFELLIRMGFQLENMDMDDVDNNRIEAWKKKISPGALKLCNDRLGPYMELMGYQRS